MNDFIKPINLDHKINEAIRALTCGKPVLFYGPSGTGKTIAAWEVANKMAETLGNKVIYLQLYPEVTKNTLIGGETIKNGNIVVDIGPILKLGNDNTESGAIFIIDECTHATEPALLGFNSLIEAPFQTVVGAEVYRLHKNTRFIFAGNTPDHSGNVPLPRSFANRLYVIDFPVPNVDDLRKIMEGVLGIKKKDPMSPLHDYILDIAVKTRSPYFSISPRNVINCVSMLGGLCKSGFAKIGKLDDLNGTIVKALKNNDMHPSLVRNAILATMLGNVTMKNDGPDKVKALLWEE